MVPSRSLAAGHEAARFMALVPAGGGSTRETNTRTDGGNDSKFHENPENICLMMLKDDERWWDQIWNHVKRCWNPKLWLVNLSDSYQWLAIWIQKSKKEFHQTMFPLSNRVSDATTRATWAAQTLPYEQSLTDYTGPNAICILIFTLHNLSCKHQKLQDSS